MGFFSHMWIGCLLAILPGPPRFKFLNAQFRLFPVDKTNKFCPEVEEGRDIGFYLFSRKFSEKPQQLKFGDDVALASSDLDLKLPTVIYFPPFFDGIDSRNVKEVKEAYIKKGGHNFIVVDSERLNAGPWYPTAVSNTFIVGKYTAAFIDYLRLKGLPLRHIHLVGLSIGAHAAGVAGKFVRFGKIPRITGLDPASFLFKRKHREMRLDKSDADLVDIIHTDRVFGVFRPMGHVDFFVNPDIYPQPGCKIKENLRKSKGILFSVFCNHLRSNALFAKSVLHPTNFPAEKCLSWNHLQLGFCKTESIELMGFGMSSHARGIYFSKGELNSRQKNIIEGEETYPPLAVGTSVRSPKIIIIK